MAEIEAEHAEVQLLILRRRAKRLAPSQPHLHPSEVPLRNAHVLKENQETWHSGWGNWQQLAPSTRARPVPEDTQLLLMVYGTPLGSRPPEAEAGPSLSPTRRLWARRSVPAGGRTRLAS